MIKAADRAAFMAALAAAHPDPKSELNWTTPFELLVAVVLSAQATDKGVNLATAKLFPVANTAETIAALGVEGLTPYIQTIGLYRNKAKNVVRLSEILRDEYAGEVPEDFEKLVALPAWAARPPTSCSTSPSDIRRFRSTRTSSASRTAPDSPRGRRPTKSKRSSKRSFPPPTSTRRTTGCSSTAAIAARPVRPNANAAPSPDGATRPKRRSASPTSVRPLGPLDFGPPFRLAPPMHFALAPFP